MRRKVFLFLSIVFIGTVPGAEGAGARLPKEVWRALSSPAEITLYSTDPDARAFHWWYSRRFHGYHILGQVSVADLTQRKDVAKVVRQAAEAYVGDTKCIFSPRHAVRLSSGGRTYDFLICFECAKMEVYEGDRVIARLSIGGSPEGLNRILRAAHIRIAR